MQNIAESLKKQREQILAETSEEALSRHTSLLEIAIISLYNRMINRLGLDAEQFRSSGAVIALGPLGRGFIGPNQPVPILFLRSDSFAWKEGWIDEILAPLEDAGWRMEPYQGTVEHIVGKAQTDLEFLLRVLEHRYISGNRQLAEQFEGVLDAFLEGCRDDLLQRVYKVVDTRRQNLSNPGSWMEPDVEEMPGGLADICAIRAACRIAGNIRSLEDAIFSGYLTREDVDFLRQADKTFGRLANLIIKLPERSHPVLVFDHQEILASKLGYSSRSGFLPVETFMQHVFQLFHGVSCIVDEFWDRLHESREDGREEKELSSVVLEPGVSARSGRIYIQTDRYPATAAKLVHLFVLSARHGLKHASVTRQWIRHHRNSLDSAAGDPAVKSAFLDLVRIDNDQLKALRSFYSHGLMTSLIPELAAVHGLVQHDAFHLYPLQEHHFQTLAELKKLFRGDYRQKEPELSSIAQNLQDPTILFLAALFHDIGKVSGKGHAARGGEMIPAIAGRLGLNADETDLLQFLVSQHLLLMDSASLRDLSDEQMLASCRSAVASPLRLDLLTLLSFADMAATGPKGLQKWYDTPVLRLYESILHILERGEPSYQAILEKSERVRNEVAQLVGDLISPEELENYFADLAPRYLVAMSANNIAKHLRLEMELRRSKEPLVLQVEVADGGAAELTLVSWETTGLVFRCAGVLTLHGLDIRGAQVFAMNSGIIILVFQCRFSDKYIRELDWQGVKSDMKRLLQGKMALSYRIAAHAARHEYFKAPMRRAPSQILIDNNSNAKYTIIEVYTLDRVGLLYTITRTLFELQIRIYIARITTKVDQVADVFYVKTHHGEKVTDPEQINEIKKALLFWLDEHEAGQQSEEQGR